MATERADRAKLFIPFDALKGFREALAEKEHITVPKAELSEEKKEELDFTLNQLRIGTIITIVYFHNDEYLKKTGMVSKISETSRSITVVSTTILFSDIYDIRIQMPV